MKEFVTNLLEKMLGTTPPRIGGRVKPSPGTAHLKRKYQNRSKYLPRECFSRGCR
jgi:hypothetical protein